MRTLGVVIIIIGILIAYLGFNGKINDAVKALKTGIVPGSGTTTVSGSADNGYSTVV